MRGLVGRGRVWRWAGSLILVGGLVLTIGAARIIDHRLTEAGRRGLIDACTAADESLRAHARRVVSDIALAAIESEELPPGRRPQYLEGAGPGVASLWSIGDGEPALRWRSHDASNKHPPRPWTIAGALAEARAMQAPNVGRCRVVPFADAHTPTAVWIVATLPDGSAWLGEMRVGPLLVILRERLGALANLECTLRVGASSVDLPVATRPGQSARGQVESRAVPMLGGALQLDYSAAATGDPLAGVRSVVLPPLLALGAGFTVLLFLVTRELAGSSERERSLQRLSDELARRDRDVRRGRAEALAASAAKTDLLRRTSHNIRSPLTNILGSVELLLSGAAAEPERARHLRAVQTSARHLLALANELLELARTESGRTSVAAEDVDIVALLEDLVESFQARTSHRAVRLGLAWLSPAPDSVGMVPTKVREILTNLLDNAVRHTERGRILLEAEARGAWLTLRVSDTGCGIEASRLPRLFEPGEQPSGPDDLRAGAGLGLTITKHLVTSLGGTIEVESTVGSGSAFTVRLPIAQSERVASLRAGGGPRPRTALVVDDAPEVRLLVRARLEAEGFSVCEAGSLAEAAVAAGRCGVAPEHLVVFLDINLPDADGLAALPVVRASLPGAVVVALTGDVDREAACLGAGFDGFLPKPFTARQLSSVLALVAGPPASKAA